MKQAALFWSAGKDSALALYKVQQDPEIKIKTLVTTLNLEYHRISMHGISEKILDRQVEQLGIPVFKMWVPNEPGNNAYEEIFLKTCQELKSKGIDTIIFGDIYLEDLRQYRESLLDQIGLKAYFPLWKISTDTILKQLVKLGFQAITCCISARSLNKDWIGKQIDKGFIIDLPSEVDPCGENGEFHTFCFAGPIFKKAISWQPGEVIYKPLMINTTQQEEETGFWFLDIL